MTTAKFIDALKIPYIAPSFGGCESIVDQPAIMSYWYMLIPLHQIIDHYTNSLYNSFINMKFVISTSNKMKTGRLEVKKVQKNCPPKDVLSKQII